MLHWGNVSFYLCSHVSDYADDGTAIDPTAEAAPAPDNVLAFPGAGDSAVQPQAEIFQASDDNETATAQTIALMCRYIARACDDPYIRQVARDACGRFSPMAFYRDHSGAWHVDPAKASWAVFWYLKHRVKKTYDEAAMFRFGMPNEQDLLTDPSVLLRMDKPAEDCDGFTMAACALLQCLGVQTKIATVACDRQDPSRWSHVFCLVSIPDSQGNAAYWPLDCSHGSRPGWMVPPQDIYRWQVWDLDGSKSADPQLEDILSRMSPPQPVARGGLAGYRGQQQQFRSPLRGYVYGGARSFTGIRGLRGLRGLGQCTAADGSDVPCDTGGSTPIDQQTPVTIPVPCLAGAGPLQAGQNYCPGYPSTGGASGGSFPGSSASGTNNWLAPLFNLLSTTARVIQNETLPVGTVIRNPDGSITANLGSGSAVASSGLLSSASLTSMEPILLIGGGLLLLALVMGKK